MKIPNGNLTFMQVTLSIPDDLALQYLAGKDPARAALEAMVLDGYRNQQLTESQVRRMLGLETRMEVHALLKEHNVYLNYSPEHLALDIENSDRLYSEREFHTKITA